MWYNNKKETNMSKTTKNARNAGKVFSTRATLFLVNNAGTLSARSIAGILGRTVKSVRRKAEKLGISLSVQ